MSEPILTAAEARVVAVLVEKSVTTPQYYPMTVNAVMNAANQKNARNPIMRLNEGEVGAALNSLERRHWVSRDDHAGRVPKWRHGMHHQLLLKSPALAMLATLMLRGSQTAAELRSHAANLGGPTDNDAFSEAIDNMQDRAEPLVTLLPRQPGQSAARYAHLLCGKVEAISQTAASAFAPARRETLPTSDSQARLEQRLTELEARVEALENGVSHKPDDHSRTNES